MSKIQMSIQELEALLTEQKNKTASYITRNLTVYHWCGSGNKVDLDLAKQELRQQCLKSDFPNDFLVLKKFIPITNQQ